MPGRYISKGVGAIYPCLFCFLAHRKPGMTTDETGKKLNISQSAVSRSSMRGERIARENRLELIEINA